MVMPMDIDQLIGKRFGMLTVLAVERQYSKGVMALMKCICDCGKQTTPQPYSLTSGRSKSCGCNQAKAVSKHGHAYGKNGSKTYTAWAQMKSRCDNPKNRFFADYGGRGIGYCDRWAKFENFLRDMGAAPEGLTLERQDNAKGYGPDNCVWATRKEQQNNRRNTRMVEFEGKSTPIQLLCDRFQINPHTLRNRLKNGWGIERALSQPIDVRKSSTNRL
jgi:hypothetical protein